MRRLHSRNIGGTCIQKGDLGEEPGFAFHLATKNTSHVELRKCNVIVSPRFEAAWLCGCSVDAWFMHMQFGLREEEVVET